MKTQFVMKSDIEIAQEAKLVHIREIAASLGLAEDDIDYYGRFKAKINLDVLKGRPLKGKLILVSAITPTPAGEGKSTTTIGLAQALNRMGRQCTIALREPSLGPCFGTKGGAAGGGFSQVVPWRRSTCTSRRYPRNRGGAQSARSDDRQPYQAR